MLLLIWALLAPSIKVTLVGMALLVTEQAVAEAVLVLLVNLHPPAQLAGMVAMACLLPSTEHQ
jgi:hypothetical protein